MMARAPRSSSVAGCLSLIALAAASGAHAEEQGLRISTQPALPVASEGSDGRRVFAPAGPGAFSLRVDRLVDGAIRDITAECALTSLTPHVSAGPGAAFSIAAVSQRTIAAIVVECPGAREIVGFVLRASGDPGQR